MCTWVGTYLDSLPGPDEDGSNDVNGGGGGEMIVTLNVDVSLFHAEPTLMTIRILGISTGRGNSRGRSSKQRRR